MQRDFKRLLGFSGIAHAGYALVGFVSLESSGFTAALYYVAMLAWVGCVADTPEVATWFGDDIAFRRDSYEVDMAGLPYLMYGFAHQLPRLRGVTGAADGEVEYIGKLLLDKGEPNISRLMIWEVMTWGMLSHAERLAPGALLRGSPSPR